MWGVIGHISSSVVNSLIVRDLKCFENSGLGTDQSRHVYIRNAYVRFRLHWQLHDTGYLWTRSSHWRWRDCNGRPEYIPCTIRIPHSEYKYNSAQNTVQNGVRCRLQTNSIILCVRYPIRSCIRNRNFDNFKREFHVRPFPQNESTCRIIHCSTCGITIWTNLRHFNA